MYKLLITGSKGYIGSNLTNSELYEIYNCYPMDKEHMDITNPQLVSKVIEEIKPDIIIHAAGFSNLKLSDQSPDTAYTINVKGIKNIVDAIKSTKTKLIFLSSDYVFDGAKGNYRETDYAYPKTVYGNTKLEAENYIRTCVDNYIIIRTANVYGRGGNFFNFLLSELNQNKTIEAFYDTYYTPTYIDYLIDCIKRLLEKDYKGTIHIVGKEEISRYGFALKMARVMNKDTELIRSVSQPKDGVISQNSSLNSDLSDKILGNYCPTIEKSLHYNFGNLVYPYSYFADHRGKITGLMQNKEWKEVNYIESFKGTVRGNHYHKKTTEAFFIIDGKIQVSTSDIQTGIKKEFTIEKGDVTIINPMILHTFKILEDARWINMLSEPMGAFDKDIWA